MRWHHFIAMSCGEKICCSFICRCQHCGLVWVWDELVEVAPSASSQRGLTSAEEWEESERLRDCWRVPHSPSLDLEVASLKRDLLVSPTFAGVPLRPPFSLSYSCVDGADAFHSNCCPWCHPWSPPFCAEGLQLVLLEDLDTRHDPLAHFPCPDLGS